MGKPRDHKVLDPGTESVRRMSATRGFPAVRKEQISIDAMGNLKKSESAPIEAKIVRASIDKGGDPELSQVPGGTGPGAKLHDAPSANNPESPGKLEESKPSTELKDDESSPSPLNEDPKYQNDKKLKKTTVSEDQLEDPKKDHKKGRWEPRSGVIPLTLPPSWMPPWEKNAEKEKAMKRWYEILAEYLTFVSLLPAFMVTFVCAACLMAFRAHKPCASSVPSTRRYIFGVADDLEIPTNRDTGLLGVLGFLFWMHLTVFMVQIDEKGNWSNGKFDMGLGDKIIACGGTALSGFFVVFGTFLTCKYPDWGRQVYADNTFSPLKTLALRIALTHAVVASIICWFPNAVYQLFPIHSWLPGYEYDLKHCLSAHITGSLLLCLLIYQPAFTILRQATTHVSPTTVLELVTLLGWFLTAGQCAMDVGYFGALLNPFLTLVPLFTHAHAAEFICGIVIGIWVRAPQRHSSAQHNRSQAIVISLLAWMAFTFMFISRMYWKAWDQYEDFIFKWSSKGFLLPIHVGFVMAAVLVSGESNPLRQLDYFQADPFVSPSWWLWIGPVTFFLSIGESGPVQFIVYLTALIVTGLLATVSYYALEERLMMGIIVPGIESAEEPPSPGSPKRGRRPGQQRIFPKVFLGRWAPSKNCASNEESQGAGPELSVRGAIAHLVAGIVLVSLVLHHYMHPATALGIFALFSAVLLQMPRWLGGAGTECLVCGHVSPPAPNEPVVPEVDENEENRCYMLDNARFVSLTFIIAHGVRSTFVNRQWYENDLLDRFAESHGATALVTLSFLSGLVMKKGMGSFLQDARRLLIPFVVINGIWYLLVTWKKDKKTGLLPITAPFVWDKDHYFSPFWNYSPGGYLWYLQALIIWKLWRQGLSAVVGEQPKRLMTASLTTWFLAVFLYGFDWGSTPVGGSLRSYVQSQGADPGLLSLDSMLMLPLFPVFVFGSLISMGQIQEWKERSDLMRPLQLYAVLFLAGWSFSPELGNTLNYLYRVHQVFMFLILPASLGIIALVPDRRTMVSTAGRNSIFVYVLYPLVLTLLYRAYYHFTGLTTLPTPMDNFVDGGWKWSVMLFIFTPLLNLALGSKTSKLAFQAVLQPKIAAYHGVGGTLLVYFSLLMLVFIPMIYSVVVGSHLKDDERWLLQMKVFEIKWLKWMGFFVILAAPPAIIELTTQIYESQPIQETTPELKDQLEEEEKPSKEGALPKFKIFWRYVTRGNNPNLLKENLLHTMDVLTTSPLPGDRWAIEVVTDKRMEGLSDRELKDVVQIVVPDEYACPNGAKYKARALHFATCHLGDRDELPHDYDWIVHLDEETRMDLHTVASVFEFCHNEHIRTKAGEDGWCNMAQGVIVYNCFGHVIENPLTALADVGRVGGDYGKFLFCSKIADRPLIGMHGSFVVANQGLEREVGLDFGITGSITEDYYFAFKCWYEKNVKVKRLNSFMFEQSPFTAVDFVRQRARWFQGNALCVFAPEFPLYIRLFGMCMLFCWSFVPMVFLSLSLNWLLPAMPTTISWLTALVCGYGLWMYLLGFVLTFNPRSPAEGGVGMPMWFMLLMLLIVLQPAFGLLEVGGTLWGMYLWLNQKIEFHIVKKELSQTSQKLAEGNK